MARVATTAAWSEGHRTGWRSSIEASTGSRAPISAAAVATLYNAGEYDHPVAQRALEYALENLGADANYLFYGHLYLSQACYQVGGEVWSDYYRSVSRWLLEAQQDDRAEPEAEVHEQRIVGGHGECAARRQQRLGARALQNDAGIAVLGQFDERRLVPLGHEFLEELARFLAPHSEHGSARPAIGLFGLGFGLSIGPSGEGRSVAGGAYERSRPSRPGVPAEMARRIR